MNEKTCPYCNNEIRPLDKHGYEVKDSGSVVRPDGGSDIQLQDVTCVLTRTVIVKVEQTK